MNRKQKVAIVVGAAAVVAVGLALLMAPSPDTGTERPTPPDDQEAERWLRRLNAPGRDYNLDGLSIEELIHVVGHDEDYYRRLGAICALGDMRARSAAPVLIQALACAEELERTAANDALEAIAGLSFKDGAGSDPPPDVLQGRWRDWWEKHGDDR